MSVTLPIPMPSQESGEPLRKRWTRDECVALEQAGIVDPEAYELIEGDLIQKVSKNSPHSLVLILLNGWLVEVFGRYRVGPEIGIDVSPEDTPTSHPEPDLTVLARPASEIRGPFGPGDISLLVEVADSTLLYDLTTKARLYARAGVPEYWVVDVGGRRIVIHRDPVDGTYRSVVAFSESEMVSCLAAPGTEIAVRELLG